MKGQFQERPKKAKKNPATPEETNENRKIKKKAAKEQAKTNNNMTQNPHQFRPNPMGPQAALYQQSISFSFYSDLCIRLKIVINLKFNCYS